MEVYIKKRTLLGVAMALLLLLSACRGQPASAESPTESGQNQVTQTPEVKTSEQTSQKELPVFALQATMEETVLVDEKDVKITATALQGTSYQVELATSAPRRVIVGLTARLTCAPIPGTSLLRS